MAKIAQFTDAQSHGSACNDFNYSRDDQIIQYLMGIMYSIKDSNMQAKLIADQKANLH
jgi:hypothetical protein